MQEFIEQLAHERSLSTDEVKVIFIAFANHLITRVPGLRQVVNAVFENTADEILQLHINKLIMELQEQQRKETFGKWLIPERYEVTHREGRYPLF